MTLMGGCHGDHGKLWVNDWRCTRVLVAQNTVLHDTVCGRGPYSTNSVMVRVCANHVTLVRETIMVHSSPTSGVW